MPIAIRRWRSPAVLRVKALIVAALGVTVAAVFFPVWFAVPVAVVFGLWELSLAVLGASVAVDSAASVVVLRTGLITRRVRLTDVAAVLVEQAKVSIARANGGEISIYAWRKSPLDNWLRVPAIADDVGHAVASAVALAQDGKNAARQEVGTGTSARTRSALATTLLGCTGALALASAFLVRLHWHDPVMTTLAVLLALALGVSGLFYVLFTIWLLTMRTPRPAGTGRARRHEPTAQVR